MPVHEACGSTQTEHSGTLRLAYTREVPECRATSWMAGCQTGLQIPVADRGAQTCVGVVDCNAGSMRSGCIRLSATTSSSHFPSTTHQIRNRSARPRNETGCSWITSLASECSTPTSITRRVMACASRSRKTGRALLVGSMGRHVVDLERPCICPRLGCDQLLSQR